MIEVLKLLGSMGLGWFKHRKEKLDAKHEVEMERLRQSGNWETTQAEASKTSWKDEWWTILLSIPCVGAFIPWMVPHIMEGFKVLDQMPDWYKALLLTAVGAAFGVRGINSFLQRKNDNKN